MSSDEANIAGDQSFPGVGDRLEGRYELVRRIGRGGMGTVFEGQHVHMARSVAIKLMHPSLVQDERFVRRFEREVLIAKDLNHRNTVRIFDFGKTDQGVMYLVMEYLDGRPLREEMDEGPMAVRRIVEVALQWLDGLAEAHSHGIIHRDIKPDNIFLSHDNRGHQEVKLLDFGVAKSTAGGQPMITAANELVGTSRYLAPEVFMDGQVSKQSDIYACGLVIMEMLYGRPVIDAESIPQMLHHHISTPILMPPVLQDNALAEVIRRAAAKNPGLRFADADAMFAALSAVSEADLNVPALTEQQIEDVFAKMEHSLFSGRSAAPEVSSDGKALTAATRVERPINKEAAEFDASIKALAQEPTEILHRYFTRTSQEVSEFVDRMDTNLATTIPVDEDLVRKAAETTRNLAMRFRQPIAAETVEISENLINEAIAKMKGGSSSESKDDPPFNFTMEITDDMLEEIPTPADSPSTITLSEDMILEVSDRKPKDSMKASSSDAGPTSKKAASPDLGPPPKQVADLDAESSSREAAFSDARSSSGQADLDEPQPGSPDIVSDELKQVPLEKVVTAMETVDKSSDRPSADGAMRRSTTLEATFESRSGPGKFVFFLAAIALGAMVGGVILVLLLIYL